MRNKNIAAKLERLSKLFHHLVFLIQKQFIFMIETKMQTQTISTLHF